MKTIQEHLRELDTEKLISTYLSEYPTDYRHIENRELTLAQIDERIITKLFEFIERMRNISIREIDDKHILYVHRCLEEGVYEQSYCLANMREVMSGDFTETSYAYELTPQEEIMGFLVAETEMTKRYIYGLAVSVLYEASFFGYEEEEKQDAIDSLEQGIKELESGDFHSHTFEDFKKEMKLNGEPFDDESPDEFELHLAAVKAGNEYSRHSALKELGKIREMLLEEMK